MATITKGGPGPPRAVVQMMMMMMMMNWSKTLMELIFNPCGKFRRNPEGAVSQIHSPHLHVDAPDNLSDLLRSVQILKREWDAENNRKLPHLSIPSKTTGRVPEFAMKDLPLRGTDTKFSAT